MLPAVNYNSGGIFATQIAVADVNGDLKPDLVVGNGYDESISGKGGVGVLLGNGDGTFQPAVTHDTGGPGSFANSVLVTDVTVATTAIVSLAVRWLCCWAMATVVSSPPWPTVEQLGPLSWQM